MSTMCFCRRRMHRTRCSPKSCAATRSMDDGNAHALSICASTCGVTDRSMPTMSRFGSYIYTRVQEENTCNHVSANDGDRTGCKRGTDLRRGQDGHRPAQEMRAEAFGAREQVVRPELDARVEERTVLLVVLDGDLHVVLQGGKCKDRTRLKNIACS